MAHAAPQIPEPDSMPVLTPAPPRAVLAALVRTASAAANEQLSAMANRLVTAMLDMTSAGPDPKAAYLRTKAGNLLKSNAYAFIHLAGEAIEAGLRAEVAELLPASAGAPALDALSLVPMDVMDNKVAFGALCRPFEIAHSEVLASLCVRLGLLLGRDLLRPAQNPFRPEVFVAAIHDAWRAFEPELEAHPLLLPLLRPELFLDLAPLLASLDAELRTHSKAKAGRLHISKSSDPAGRGRRPGMDAALAQQLRNLLQGTDGADSALVPDLPNMPQGKGWRPSAASGFCMSATGEAGPAGPNAPAASGAHAQHGDAREVIAAAGFGGPGGAAGRPVAGASLLDLLAGLTSGLPAAFAPASAFPSAAAPAPGALPHNVFYLPRLKASLPQGSLSRGEEHTLDLLSRIFETVLLDDSIPPETRELIRFLQVPVLKAALLDQDFFFEEAHPARKMIDLVSRMGWEQRSSVDDPVVQAMRRGVERVGRQPQAQPEAMAAVFAESVADLEAELAREERAAEEAIAAPIARATQLEKQALASRSARQAIAVRLADGELTAVVSSFLEQRWVDVLTFAWLIEDERPGAVDNATRAMDELVWTVKPKATQEQRRALIAKLPGLLATLNKWLDAVKWQDAQRLEFFAELAKCHLSIVRAPLDLSPQRQLELAVEAAQQDALRRIANEQAVAHDDDQAAEPPGPIDELERGMHLAFTQPDGSVRKVKLAWVSPLRTLFIFSAGARQESFSLPADKLVHAFQAGSVSVVSLEGVVGRVLTQAMQEAVNDAG
ncbi:DUF1631 family protein [Massilia niabensis]|uniref:DUF1631 family protein n=1 Tax=Massilia niabensis TaxID=544910 RepID=A0ABW0L503_9BURK